MNQDDANVLMCDFENHLDDLIAEYLADTDITKEQINVYYSWVNDCPLAEKLEETRELTARL